jgi:conjugative transfer signal peptidase TraF
MNQTHRTVLSIVGISAVLALSLPPIPRNYALVYNPTASAPKGWYVVERDPNFRIGDYVLVRLPNDAARLASDRHYLPSSVPILKRVGALGRQFVCLSGDRVVIDGRVVAHALVRDGAGRHLASWAHCRPLTSDELFLLSLTNPSSFDSRYFGPIPQTNVIGKATPLWTW